MADSLRVNGNLHSWGSVILKVNGDRYYGVTQIAYGDKRERTLAWGIGRHQAPRARSRGKYTPDDLSFTMYRDSARTFIDALSALSSNGLSYGDVQFDAVIQTIEPDLLPLTVTITGCVITAVTESNDEGSDPLTTQFTAQPLRIYRDRKTLFDSTEGA